MPEDDSVGSNVDKSTISRFTPEEIFLKIGAGLGAVQSAVLILNVLKSIVTSPVGTPIFTIIANGIGLQFLAKVEPLQAAADNEHNELQEITLQQEILDLIRAYVIAADALRRRWKDLEDSVSALESDQERITNECCDVFLDATNNAPDITQEYISSVIERVILYINTTAAVKRKTIAL